MNVKNITLKGNLFYFAIISLVGVLSVLESYIYGGLFLLAILYLHKIKKSAAGLIILFILCYLVYIAAGFIEKKEFTTSHAGNEKAFLLSFIEEVTLDGDMLYAFAEALPSGEKMAVRYRINSEKEKDMIKDLMLPGVACKASGNLETPSSARNPNSFNYQSYLQKNQISWLIKVDKLFLNGCIYISDDVMTGLKRFRQKEIYAIEENFPRETAALSAALLFGDRRLFDPDIERAYQKIGIVHLLAISGLHVGLLSGMLYFICIRIGLPREKTELLMLVFLPIYAVISGLAPPVIRAATMLMLLIGTRHFRLRLTPLDAISAAFMVMIISQPNLIYDIGFQLSFSVSFSLVISVSILLASFNSVIHQTAAASLIAQLSSLPVILNSFYELSVVSVMANLLFVPLFSFLVLPVILINYIIFSIGGGVPNIFLRLTERTIHLINSLSASIAEIPGSILIMGKPGMEILILMIMMVPAFFIYWEKFILQKKKTVGRLLLVPLAPLLLHLVIPYINPYGEVIFIDVGQGDSILIRMPYDKGNYLIDTGGVMQFEREEWQERKESFEPGKDIVLPLLKSKGVRRIDKLILTHGDTDHIGGAASLFGEIPVDEMILPRSTERSRLQMDIIKMALAEGTMIYFGGKGDSWRIAGGEFKILGPSGASGERNDRSIILKAKLGGKTWLFTGDLGIDGEQALIHQTGELDIDVLKVGHHGSKYSTSDDFLQALTPEYAIISAGLKNRYGHPGREVLERLDNSRVHTFRTDKNGAVIYRFKEESGTFFTQIP